MERNLYVKTKINTGRGGTGNIVAASVAQSIPFDKSLDPDDSYEQIVFEVNKKAQKVSSTGRGGAGNLSGMKIKEKKEGRRRRSNSIPARLSLSRSGNAVSHSFLSQTCLTSSSLPISPEMPNLTYSPTSPLPSANSVLSFVTPSFSPLQTSPADDFLGDSPQKSRWWKFIRRQRNSQQNLASPKHPMHKSLLDVRILPEDAEERQSIIPQQWPMHNSVLDIRTLLEDPEEEQNIAPPQRPMRNSVLDVRTLPEDVHKRLNHLRLYKEEQGVSMNGSSPTIEYDRPGREPGQYMEDAEDRGEDDDESWESEVLEQAADEVNSFLEFQ